MVLLNMFLRVTRALCLPFFVLIFTLRWLDCINFCRKPTPQSQQRQVISRPSLWHLPDFNLSGHLLLTDTYCLNHWFVAMMQVSHYFQSTLFLLIMCKAYLSTTLIMQVVYAWFQVWAKEPPDKDFCLFPEGEVDDDETLKHNMRMSCFDTKVDIKNPLSSDKGSTNDIDDKDDKINLVIKPSEISDALKKEPTGSTCTHQCSCQCTTTTKLREQLHFDWTSARRKIAWPRMIRCNVLHSLNISLNNTGSQFDLQSIFFVLDTGSSDHLCRTKSLFHGSIKPLKGVKLQGVGGQIEAKGYGTIKFDLNDDEGVRHTFMVHNVLYVPDAPMNLLSPQKWIAGMTDAERLARGAMTITMDDVSILLWDKRRFMKTIHHRPSIGLPIIAVNETLKVEEIGSDFKYPICQPCFPVYARTSTRLQRETPNLIEDDNGYVPQSQSNTIDKYRNSMIVPLDEEDETEYAEVQPQEVRAPDEDSAKTIVEEVADRDSQEGLQENLSNDPVPEPTTRLSEGETSELLKALQQPLTKDEREFMTIHHKLKHLPERYLHRLAEQGVIPKKFAKIKLPPCPACIFGKQHKRPWRSRGKQKNIRKDGQIHPGDGTSVDQLESRHPGLVPQTKGFHRTTERYVGATIFVDHATNYTYVHMIKDFTGEENMEAKQAYEAKADQHGVRVRSYHGDNGRFAEALWITDASEKNQSMSFCGVGSHFQNGIAEKRIRDLTEYARTLLVHGSQIWPEAVKLALWPYALKEAERIFNEFRVDDDGLTPLQRFAKVKAKPDLKQEHPLFCPTYALDANLQGGSSIPRWEPRSRAGVYLGRSKHHASNVALVLNLATGNVSPQYHLTFDDTFSTVPYCQN